MEQRRFKVVDDEWKQYFVVVEHTKSDVGSRTIPVVGKASEILQMVKDANVRNSNGCSPDDFIFLYENKRVTSSSIVWLYGKYCDKLGITKREPIKLEKLV